jgi:hypothetical protein
MRPTHSLLQTFLNRRVPTTKRDATGIQLRPFWIERKRIPAALFR